MDRYKLRYACALGVVLARSLDVSAQDAGAVQTSESPVTSSAASGEAAPASAERADQAPAEAPLPTKGTAVGQPEDCYQPSGEFFFTLGVVGLWMAGIEARVGYGLFMRGYYETGSLNIGLGLRSGFSPLADSKSRAGGIDVGGRYFFSGGDWSPFVGVGVGVVWLSVDEGEGNEWRHTGFSPALELGVEFLRLHEGRLHALLRADIPLFEAERDEPRSAMDMGEPESRYILPVTLMVGYSF